MEIITAKSAGFCFGVEKAVNLVYEELRKEENRPIYTYGPIIHNEIVNNDFKAKGVQIIDDLEALAGVEEGTVIIRSHGVPKKVYDLLEERKIHYVDGTCPFVKRIHNIVAEKTAQGEFVIIIGNPAHPEVEGIRGWGNEKIEIISDEAKARAFTLEDKSQKVTIVAQTTFNHNKFKELVEIILGKGYNVSVCNTICSATRERQAEAREIASRVDAMIVIGDMHSSNSQKLFEICKDTCEKTFFVQTIRDLDKTKLKDINVLGITAGASTPNKTIEEVQKGCQI